MTRPHPHRPWMCALAATALALSVGAPGVVRAGPEEEAAPRARPDAITVTPEKDMLTLEWHDAEDALKGAVLPSDAREGDPLKVSLRVGSYYGDAFKGPVTITLRAANEQGGQVQTVEQKDGTWVASFVPRATGPHLLDVGFRTTRYKSVHAALSVGPSRLPRALAWALVAFIALLALGLGIYRMLRRPSSEPPLTT